jgi:L-aspartate oxidase
VADEQIRPAVQRAMTRGAGVLRSADSLRATASELARLGTMRGTPRTASWEATNLLTVASALVAAAHVREETRGCHWRDDFPVARDEWLGHLVGSITSAGMLDQTWEARS